MKSGLHQILPLEFGIDLDTVKQIDFVFVQGTQKRLECTYPSDCAYRKNNTEDIVYVEFSEAMTSKFVPKKTIYVDTKVYLNDSDINPQTEITSFEMEESLF